MNLKRIIAITLLFAFSLFGKGHASSSGSKPIHVREYTRKDGTVVQAHDRAMPGTAASPTKTSEPITPHVSVPKEQTIPPPAAIESPFAVKRTTSGRIERSEAAKRSFEESHPCPATGRTGSCPGYVVDHVTPLACGGADVPSNMQWQSIAEGKAKDRTERIGCK